MPSTVQVIITTQTGILLLFFLLGTSLCFLRDLLMFFSGFIFGKKMSANITDLLFFIVLTSTTYLSFLLTTNGKIRIYLLCIELIGFLLWRYFLGRLYRRKMFRFSIQTHLLFNKMIRAIMTLFCSFFEKIVTLLKKLFAFIKKLNYGCKTA